MSEDDIIHPDYIRIIERTIDGWLFKRGKMFYRTRQLAVDCEDYELLTVYPSSKLHSSYFASMLERLVTT